MFITVTTDGDEIYNLEIDSQMAIEDLKALLEAEVCTLTIFSHLSEFLPVDSITKYFLRAYSLVFHLKSSIYFITDAN